MHFFKIFLPFLIVYILSIGEAHLFGQEEGRIHIPKCARVETSFILRTQLSDSSGFDQGGSINYSYCIKSANRTGFGMGSSVEFFRDEAFIPLYFDGIYFISKEKKRLFAHAQFGYAFGFLQKFEPGSFSDMRGGIYTGGGVGYKIYTLEQLAFYISATYHYQKAHYYKDNGASVEEIVPVNYNLFVLSMGIMLEQP